MAAGFGLVASVTAVGVLVYYVAPTAWALRRPGPAARQLAVAGHLRDVRRPEPFHLSGHVAQTLTSVGFWIVLPVTVGLVLANRREVK